MAKFLLTKIIFILIVDLALASAATKMIEKTGIPSKEGGNNPNVMVLFHNQMGNGEMITAHPHALKTDWGTHDLPDNKTGLIEFHNLTKVTCDFKWAHGKTSGDVFLFDRDSKRCWNWECAWNITMKGVFGINFEGKPDILFKWKAII